MLAQNVGGAVTLKLTKSKIKKEKTCCVEWHPYRPL